MPLFSKKKMLGGERIVPMPRQRSNSLFQKLQRRQKIVEQREGAEIEPIMEVRFLKILLNIWKVKLDYRSATYFTFD